MCVRLPDLAWAASVKCVNCCSLACVREPTMNTGKDRRGEKEIATQLHTNSVSTFVRPCCDHVAGLNDSVDRFYNALKLRFHIYVVKEGQDNWPVTLHAAEALFFCRCCTLLGCNSSLSRTNVLVIPLESLAKGTTAQSK